MTLAQDVKQNVDIVQVVEQYAPLQRAGRNFKALCPFHVEKTPSFYLFPEGQSWHCFGACGTGGDVFTFVMKKESLDFGGALRLLADRAGYALPDKERRDENKSVLERLIEANEAAAQYYHNALLDINAAQIARKYLTERSIDESTAKRFTLGFSPTGWSNLRSHLRARGYSDEELMAAGLVLEGEGGLRDRFHGRLMFPIRDPRGRVVGLGARSLPGLSDNPKYINSPQTPIFDKGGLLYALDRAKEGIQREGTVVIVEGYMDVIMAHQNGIDNVVASMGTAINEKQFHLLRGLTNNVALALDADAAGDAAALRGVVVAARSMDRKVAWRPEGRGYGTRLFFGDTVRVVALPAGKDPDDIIRGDPDLWRELVASGLPIVEHLLSTLPERYDLTQPRGQTEAIETVLTILDEVGDPTHGAATQAHYIQKLARLVRVPERDLQEGLNQRRQSRQRREKGQVKASQPALERTGVARAPFAREHMENHVLSILIQHPETKKMVMALQTEHFTVSDNREIFFAWQQAPSHEEFFLNVDPTLHDRLDELASASLPPIKYGDLQRLLEDSWMRLEEYRLRGLQGQLRMVIEEIEASLGANKMWLLPASPMTSLSVGPEVSTDNGPNFSPGHEYPLEGERLSDGSKALAKLGEQAIELDAKLMEIFRGRGLTAHV
ncbi:MAG: dnaG [Dehalococcoidia bacterium]|nr:dnaG [Dehalococcoidia bacterium]